MKFDLSSASLAILAAALAPVVNAVCQSGEVGMGETEIWQWELTTNVLTSQNAGIYTTNCDLIHFSDAQIQTNPCVGSYGSGTGVACDGKGNPNFVWTTGGTAIRFRMDSVLRGHSRISTSTGVARDGTRGGYGIIRGLSCMVGG